VDTKLDAQARLAFCQETLCRIDLAVSPTPEPAALAKRLEKVLALLTERYGKPARREASLPGECMDDALPGCLEKDLARFVYEWSWSGKRSITLTLGAKKPTSAFAAPPARSEAELTALKTIRIRYNEGRTPDPVKGAASAEPEPEGDRGVTGL
jgi:hypothetical protein